MPLLRSLNQNAGEWFPITMTLLPELLPIERLEDGASSVRSAMSIATRLSKAGKLRRSGMLVESASHSNIQPLQCPTALIANIRRSLGCARPGLPGSGGVFSPRSRKKNHPTTWPPPAQHERNSAPAAQSPREGEYPVASRPGPASVPPGRVELARSRADVPFSASRQQGPRPKHPPRRVPGF